ALGFIHRYDLGTARLDGTAAVPVPGRIDGISMGNDSAGPLLATWTPRDDQSEQAPRWFSLIDPETLRSIPTDPVRPVRESIRPERPQPGAFQIGSFDSRRHRFAMRASAGGDLFALWSMNVLPSGIHTVAIRGRAIEMSYQHDDAGSLAPGPDGRTI